MNADNDETIPNVILPPRDVTIDALLYAVKNKIRAAKRVSSAGVVFDRPTDSINGAIDWLVSFEQRVRALAEARELLAEIDRRLTVDVCELCDREIPNSVCLVAGDTRHRVKVTV